MFADILRQLMDSTVLLWSCTIRKQATSIYAPCLTPLPLARATYCAIDDITLIANGIMVAELEAARQLEQEGVSAAVIDMFTLKPIDRMLVKTTRKKRGIVT